jgi:CheY-like chemotaxis protein
MPNVLLVDDSPIDRTLYKHMLSQHVRGLTFEEGGCAKDAVDLLRAKRFDCAFLDYLLPDGNGLEVLMALQQVNRTPVVMLTANEDPETAVEALRSGAVDYLIKQRLNPGLLVSAFEGAVIHGSREHARETRIARLTALHNLLQQSEDVFLVVDLTDHKLVEATAVGLARLGYRRGEVLERDVRTLALFETAGGWDAFLLGLHRSERKLWVPVGASGRPTPCEVTGYSLRVENRQYLMAHARPV